MKKHTLIISLLTLLVGVMGCQQKLPDGFPKVYPMTVTVTDGSTPIPNARVAFLKASAGSGGSVAVGGTTGADGSVAVQTSQGAFASPGIPAGEYVVTVEDVMNIDLGKTPEEIASMNRAEQGELEKKRQELIKAYQKKVPEVLNKKGKNEDRSPIRFTAAEGKNELTIDVSQYK